MMVRKYFILLIFLIECSFMVFAKPVIRASITKSFKQRVVVAYPFTYGTEAKIKELDAIIRKDLKLSGLVSMISTQNKIDQLALKESVLETDYQAWQRFGPEFLVKVELGKKLGVLSVRYAIFNCYDKKMIVKKKMSIPKKRFRETVHSISDQILLKITGKKGLGSSRIAFVSDKRGMKTIYSSDIHGEGVIQLVFDKAMVISPDWGPDRESILYTSYRNVNPVIFIKYFNDNHFESVASYPGLNANGKINNRNEVVFTASKDGNPEVYKKNILTGKANRLTRRYGVDANACWSPDGEKIAFVSSGTGATHIFLMDRNGENSHRLTRGSSYNTAPSFSFDGRYLAFCTRIRGHLNLALYDFSTNQTELIVSRMKDAEAPNWSPNSHHIAFASNKRGKYDIYIIDIETKEITRVTKGIGNCTNPSWK